MGIFSKFYSTFGDWSYTVAAIILFLLAFVTFMLTFMVTTRAISARTRKEELDKIDEAFDSLLENDGYTLLKDDTAVKRRFASWKNPPNVNKVITRRAGEREILLADLMAQEERTADAGSPEPAGEKSSKPLVDRYFTQLIVNIDYQIQGSIQLKPRHSLEGYVSDVPVQEGDTFVETIPDFNKRYMVKYIDITEEVARYVLTPEVQRILVTRAGTYPVNSDVRWITVGSNVLLIECCRIRNSEDLKKLVAFADQLIDRIKGIKPAKAENGNGNGNGTNPAPAAAVEEKPAETPVVTETIEVAEGNFASSAVIVDEKPAPVAAEEKPATDAGQPA